MARALRDLAREIASEPDLPDDPAEAAAYVASELRKARPDTTSSGRQRAAASVIPGAPPPLTRAQAAAAQDAKLENRIVDRAATLPGRVGRRARRRLGRELKTSRRFGGARTVGDVVRTGFLLVGLYWLIRQGPRAVEAATTSIRSGLAWLADPSATIR